MGGFGTASSADFILIAGDMFDSSHAIKATVSAACAAIGTMKIPVLVTQRSEPLYLTKCIERMGTSTRDMIQKCIAAGLPEPEFSLTDSFVATVRRNAVSKSHHVGSRNAPPVGGQVTGQVDPWILRGLTACAANSLTSREIQEATGLRHRETFQRNYLDQLLGDDRVEVRWPEINPPSRRIASTTEAEAGQVQ